jgi:hypothetical protein
MITIWASDFNASSYHLCNSYFTFSSLEGWTSKASIDFERSTQKRIRFRLTYT